MQSLSQNVDGIGSSLTEMEGLVQKQGRAADEAERKLATLEQGEFGGGLHGHQKAPPLAHVLDQKWSPYDFSITARTSRPLPAVQP